MAHAILKFWFHHFHHFGKILTIRAKYLFKLFFWSIIFLVFPWNSNYPYTFFTMSTMTHILFCTLVLSPWALLWIYSIDPSFYSLIISYCMFDMMVNPLVYRLLSIIISFSNFHLIICIESNMLIRFSIISSIYLKLLIIITLLSCLLLQWLGYVCVSFSYLFFLISWV